MFINLEQCSWIKIEIVQGYKVKYCWRILLEACSIEALAYLMAAWG